MKTNQVTTCRKFNKSNVNHSTPTYYLADKRLKSLWAIKLIWWRENPQNKLVMRQPTTRDKCVMLMMRTSTKYWVHTWVQMVMTRSCSKQNMLENDMNPGKTLLMLMVRCCCHLSTPFPDLEDYVHQKWFVHMKI